MRSPIFISVEDQIDGYDTFRNLVQMMYCGTIVTPISLYSLDLVASMSESLGLLKTSKKVDQIT